MHQSKYLNNIIAVSSGDSASIATLITLKSWLKLKDKSCPFFLVANIYNTKKIIDYFRLPIIIKEIFDPKEAISFFHNFLPVFNIYQNKIDNVQEFLGRRNLENIAPLLESLNTCIDLVKSNKVQAIVTNPIDKALVNEYLQGSNLFRGHTEYLAEKADVKKPIMMLCSPFSKLKVIPITTHISMKEVVSTINKDKIIQSILQAYMALRSMGVRNLNFLILGLNPHAGEAGLMGKEEIDIIIPAVEELKKMGIKIDGPVAADTAFTLDNIDKYDIIFGIYHDQVLIPFKTLYFNEGVNATLGLPFIRTSPDHGTAFSMAKDNRASEGSLVAAIIQAHNLARGIF
jgi:4-hydroxythreonine-4-phosphate dehydrogenase